MDFLLIVAVVLLLLALLGFGGIWTTLRSVAWLVLLAGLVVLVLAFLF